MVRIVIQTRALVRWKRHLKSELGVKGCRRRRCYQERLTQAGSGMEDCTITILDKISYEQCGMLEMRQDVLGYLNWILVP